MSYTTIEDIQGRMTRVLSTEEQTVCENLIEDACVMIDGIAADSPEEAKKIVVCRMVIRAIGDGSSASVPIGASQGSVSALGYSQSWTIGGGSSGELYITRKEKKILGLADRIGTRSPLEDLGEEQAI